MKKIFFFLLMLAMAVACNIVEMESDFSQNGKESASGVQMITEIISGSHGSSTKATIANADASFKWTAGDKLAVHVSNGDSHMYVETSSGASVSQATASFTVEYESGYHRDAFAVYPSTIVTPNAQNYGQSGSQLDVKLPSSYTLDQVKGETSPCPMIASNTDSGWEFYQLCGLLRLTVNSIPPSTSRLEINFNGRKVCGTFSIASPVNPKTSVIATTAIGDTDTCDIIKIIPNGNAETLNNNSWLDGQVLNIPLPIVPTEVEADKYKSITITAYNAGGDTILTMTRAFNYKATRENGTKRTASFPVFSVSSSKRVFFSPGNLQATYKNNKWTWSFADNQYDYVGNSSGNAKINGNGSLSIENGTVDLFGTSTSINYYGITNSTSTDGTFVDWGTIQIFKHKESTTTYTPGYWITLTEAEWKYVTGDGNIANTNYRNKGGTVSGIDNALCTKAKVNGINGFILFPDYYAGGTPQGVTWDNSSISKGKMENSGTDGWGTTVPLAGWTVLENEGCVFLPAAGHIKGSETSVTLPGDYGTYKNSDTYRFLRFDNDGFDPDHSGGTKANRRSVRLVHEIK